MEDLEESAKENLKNIDKIRGKIEKDIIKNKEERHMLEAQQREFDKMLNDRSIGMNLLGPLMIFAKLQILINRDTMTIYINNKKYLHSQFGDILEVAKERHNLLQEAKKSGIELTDETKKRLECDLIGALIDSKIEFLDDEKLKEKIEQIRDDEMKSLLKTKEKLSKKEKFEIEAE